nr:excalibur calcium-binding domain-containing protein [Actinoplanes polyasparticus]
MYYKNCAAVRKAGADPIYRGDPGYGRHSTVTATGSAASRKMLSDRVPGRLGE